jgi:hypothetical protein
MKYFLLSSVGWVLSTAWLFAQDLQRGDIIDTVYCRQNKSYYYCLYLPSNYVSTQKYPVIYAFDPAARAKMPVELLRTSADVYGYILVGVYSYKNGPVDFDGVNVISEDISTRFNIDEKRIYTTGFSGGSRFASGVAILAGNIRGVIACGAGFMVNYPYESHHYFDYVGLIGNLDMNYREMCDNRSLMLKNNMPNRMFFFQAGHQYPSAYWMNQAVQWLEVRAMKSKLKPVNQEFINQNFETQMQFADSLFQSGSHWWAYQEYLQIRLDFEGLRSVGDVAQKIQKIENQSDFIQIKENQNQLAQKEREYMQTIFTALENKPIIKSDSIIRNPYPLAWWNRFYEKLQKVKDPAEKQIVERMIDLIWRSEITQYESDERNKNYEMALFRCQVWEIVRPSKPFPHYYLARTYSLMNKANKACAELAKAFELGFKDKDYLKNDKAFDNIRTHKKYIELIQKL